MRTGRKSYVAVDDLGNFTHSPVTTLEVGRELSAYPSLCSHYVVTHAKRLTLVRLCSKYDDCMHG